MMTSSSSTNFRSAIDSYYGFARTLEADVLQVKQHLKTASEAELQDIFDRRRELEAYYASAARELSGRELQALDESYQRIQGLFQPKKKTDDRESLLTLQKMLKMKQGSLDECFPIFKALGVETKNRIYELLCQKYGAPTGDVKNDGIAHFLGNPFVLVDVLDEMIPASRPVSSQGDDKEILLQLKQMLKSKNKPAVEQYFEVFKTLTAATKNRIYDLLCEKYGSPTGNTKKDGIAHFLRNPSAALADVMDQMLPESRSRPVARYVVPHTVVRPKPVPRLTTRAVLPVSKPVSSQGDDKEILLKLKQMLKSRSKPAVEQYFEVFKTLSAPTKSRIYELLCEQHGSPTNNTKKDGIAHFLRNPSAALADVMDQMLPESRSRFAVSYSAVRPKSVSRLSTRADLPPPRQVHTDVAPYVREPWEKDVAPITREQVCQSMDRLMRNWHVNRTEMQETRLLSEDHEEKGETAEDRKQELRELDKRIFLYMKQNHGIETPMEFLWSLQNYRLREPMRIATRPVAFVPDEGQFYKIDCFGDDCPLRKPGQHGDAVEGYDYFACAVKRKGNELHLYLDGISQGGYLLINGKMYPYAGSGRGGNSKPSYRFKEGDVVCEGGIVSKYLFTVGKNGTILYPANERQGYEEETGQTVRFNEDNSRRQGIALRFTTRDSYAGEVVEPFEPGFALYSGVQQTY